VLTFTDAQLAQVKAAVALLPQHARDNFMRSLAGMLDGITRPTDGQLVAALCELLAMRGVAVGRRAFMAPNQTNNARPGNGVQVGRSGSLVAPRAPPLRPALDRRTTPSTTRPSGA
jgi:hypothetical protein